jgi:hypothetical protein
MTDQGPRGEGEEHHWLDRDTEPIPRARHDAEPGRHAAEAGDADPDDPGHPGSPAGPAGPAAERDDPFLDEPTPFIDEADDAEERPRDKPRPSPRRGAHRDPGDRVDDETPAGGPLDEDELIAAGGGGGRNRGTSFDDDDTVIQEFPDDFDDRRSRYGTPSTVGASFVVGEPITEEEISGLRGGTPAPLVTSRRVVPLEDEASPLVQRYIFATEKFRGEWRRHPIALFKEIGIAVLVTIGVGLLAGYLARVNAADEISGILVIGWLGVIVWAAIKIVDWWYDRFILTNKRVMVVSGVISRNVAMMPLQRVTDMKYVQTALGRLLSYGTFELESAGQDQALRSIPYLPSPNDLYLRIVEEMYEPEAVEARLAGEQAAEVGDGT